MAGGAALAGDQQVMQSEQALSKREHALNEASRDLKETRRALDKANSAMDRARSAVDKADSAVFAAAEDIRNAKTDEDRAEARQDKLSAMQQRDKAEQRYEEAKKVYEEAKKVYEEAKKVYEKAKKDAQDLFAEQQEQAIAFRDCIPSERTSQHARALASMIKKGEDEFQSLEYQRKALQLPGLAKPLPYGSSEHMNMSTALWFVQRVGPGLDEFSGVVKGLVEPTNPQEREVLVVAQSSGSGKTKLAYDVALQKGIVSVTATVVRPGSTDLAAPFAQLENAEPGLREAMVPHGAKNETELLKTFRGYLFVVLLAAHMEWAAHVAEELHKLGPRQRTEADANRAILLATSNGASQPGISSMVQDRLGGIAHFRKVEPAALFADWMTQYVSSAATKLKGAQLALRGKPPGSPSPQVLVTIDEAPKLISQHFGTGSGLSGTSSDNRRSRNWLRGAARALAVLTENRVATCMTGTFFDVAKLLDDTYSSLRGRTRAFYHPANITSTHVWHDLLRRHVPTLPEAIPPSIQDHLERLEGRPIFLFDQLLAQVLRNLVKLHVDESEWPEDIRTIEEPSARRLAGILFQCLPGAWDRSVDTMVERIETFTLPSEDEDEDGLQVLPQKDESQLLLQLLESVFLDGGQLPMLTAAYGTHNFGKDKKVMEDAVSQGVLVYDPTGRGSVLQEPATVEAVRKVGRNLALSQSSPMKDEWLRNKSLMLTQKGGDGAKGGSFEHAFSWMLLRACNGKGDGVKLQDALAKVVPSGFVFPKYVGGKIVKITGASRVPMVGDGSKMDDWRAMSGTSTIWYGFHQDAGMDLMLRTTDGMVIGVQAKSGKVDLADAVASCSLGWQYVSRSPVAGQPFMFLRKPTKMRRQFLDHAPIAAGEEHLRLVFSVRGFSPSAVDAANAYNELHPQSAILLCQSSEAVLGLLHGALAGLTDDVTIGINPSQAAAALIVHQKGDGESGLQGGGQSFSEWLVEAKKEQR